MARLKYWVWLSCVVGVRPVMKVRLARTMGGPEAVFFAKKSELLEAEPLLTDTEANKLMDKSMEKPSKALSYCQEHGIQILTVQDADYPDRLRQIADPPPVLYVWGKLPPVDDRALIAVVGTRRATPYGLKMAGIMGRDLALGGAIVTSGLAEGCDGAAMEAALRAGGLSVGVLGTAIDEVYPAKNRWLFDAVKAQGAVISEYAPGMRTFPSDFKQRNRIISGLSLGVVIVEAPLHSGTRNTADHALEQNRDVFAVPGNADAPASAGCNELIMQGAVPVTGAAAVLRAYSARSDLFPQEPGEIHIKKEIDKPKDIVYIDVTEAPPPDPDRWKDLPEPQRKVMEALTGKDMHADELIAATGLSAPEILSALTMLQLAGHVVQGDGKRYSRKA